MINNVPLPVISLYGGKNVEFADYMLVMAWLIQYFQEELGERLPPSISMRGSFSFSSLEFEYLGHYKNPDKKDGLGGHSIKGEYEYKISDHSIGEEELRWCVKMFGSSYELLADKRPDCIASASIKASLLNTGMKIVLSFDLDLPSHISGLWPKIAVG